MSGIINKNARITDKSTDGVIDNGNVQRGYIKHLINK